ncbi:hypothetical protein [Marivirga harenae]|uniref:hypothetical protein n=1 Tax=Marivirga harenae TaxID=2010992 RepID=UPI0026E0D98B|nr:hypothetical protein [Marivirga harenae]WKV11764.1 hypothetical protein Q3Y49_16300 [Marivirga harenae]|tara:strand:+ start:268436 stop:269476 length:1041 start_codon:yes stop_codon:yes gene_type:complete
MRIVIITLFLLSISSPLLLAQSSCQRNLNEARADYSNGNLYAVPGKLGDCLEEGFTKTERIEALELLTLTYININQQEKARTTLIRLLNLKTDYQVIKNVDPSELYSLYQKIDTDIKYFIGITAGLNLNSMIVYEAPNTNPLGTHTPNYESQFTFRQVGAQFLYPITKDIIAGAEIQYQNHRFFYRETNDYGDNDISNISYQSSNDAMNLNLMLRYMKDFYQWKPFIELGTTGRYNLNYRIVSYINNYEKSVDDEIINEPINILQDRSKFNISLNANIGSMIKVRENYMEIKFGVSNYFRYHASEEALSDSDKDTILNSMALKEHSLKNLVYQLNFTFNIPFFNFQ